MTNIKKSIDLYYNSKLEAIEAISYKGKKILGPVAGTLGGDCSIQLDVSAGDTSIRVLSTLPVADCGSFWVVIAPFTNTCEIRQATAQDSGNFITLSSALSYGHNKGTAVHWTANPSINVKWFGAVGDGSTDDTDSILSAIESLSYIGDTGDSGLVYFPGQNSIYKTTATIECKSTSLLFEPGSTLDFYSSGPAIKFSGDGSADYFYTQGGVYNCRIKLNIDGAIGVKAYQTRRTKIEDLIVLGQNTDNSTAVILDGGLVGSTLNKVSSVFAYQCASGIRLETSEFGASWCNLNKIDHCFMQNCGTAMYLNHADSNIIMYGAQSSVSEDLVLVNSDTNHIYLRQEYDFSADINLDNGSSKNVLEGNINTSTIVAPGFKTTFLHSTYYPEINEFSLQDGTPNVAGGALFTTNSGNAVPYSITFFENGTYGQEINVVFADNVTNVVFSGTGNWTLKGNEGVNWQPQINDHMTCLRTAYNWLCSIHRNS